MKHITKIAIATMALTVTPSLYSQSSPIFSSVENPIIPSTVTFAGQQVNLDRTDMYERFDRELTSMAYTHGNTLLVIKRANRYFPELIPILKKNGLPEDLIYLACIESTDRKSVV